MFYIQRWGRKAQGSAAIIGPECFKNNLKTLSWQSVSTGAI